MKLSGDQAKQFQEALLQAFPRPMDLQRLVRFRLDKNLAEIVERGTLIDHVFNLIRWAEANGFTERLILGAVKENPSNPALREFAAGMGLAAPAGSTAELGAPAPGKAGILVDNSHAQFEWDHLAIANTAKAAQMPSSFPSQEIPWEIRVVEDRRQLNAEMLKSWAGLVMALPFHERIEDSTQYEIIQWVRAGGRLLLLGYELGERHHETNINALAEDFGLRFNADIVAPPGWKPPGKPYYEPIDFLEIQSAHPVLVGIQRLRLYRLCTLTAEPGSDLILTLGKNTLCRMERSRVVYDSKGWLRGGYQDFEVVRKVDWVPVMAEAPTGLTQDGGVLALGTWNFFEKGNQFPAGFDNQQLFINLMIWLGRVK
jgi:hypothetical protein